MPRILPSIAVGLLVGLVALEWRHTAEIERIRVELARVSQRGDTARATGVTSISPTTIDVASSPVTGAPTATVALVVFSDFVCPACGRFARTTHPALESRFEGRLAVFFKFAALLDHPFSRSSAALASCTADSGKFWDVHDLLFGPRAPRDDGALLLALEGQLRLDPPPLERCALGPGIAAVNRDLALAESLGVRSTPTIFIGALQDGRVTASTKIHGAQDTAIFVATVDEALATSTARPVR